MTDNNNQYTGQQIVEQLQRLTGHPARINEDTKALEVFIDGEWKKMRPLNEA